MKISIFLFSIFLLSGLSGRAEYFYIKNYDVLIRPCTDGSILVEETILVDFTAPRRGIIRTIPCRYRVREPMEGEIAEGFIPGIDHVMQLQDIKVENEHFYVTRNYQSVSIKIGREDSLIRGEHEYHIRYRVWGAIKQFSTHQELSWNIIGHQWDCEIQNCTFRLVLPVETALESDDVHITMGKMYKTDTSIYISYLDSTLTGTTSRILYPNEGITADIRLPSEYFSNTKIPVKLKAANYYVDSLHTDIDILANGIININQQFFVKFKAKTNPDRDPLKLEYKAGYHNYTRVYRRRYIEKYKRPNAAFFNSRYKLLVINESFNNNGFVAEKDMVRTIYWPVEADAVDTVFSYEYQIYGHLLKEGPFYIYNAPLFLPVFEPIRAGSFSVSFPDDIIDNEIVATASIRRDYWQSWAPVKFSFQKSASNELTARLPISLESNMTPSIYLKFPASVVSESGTGLYLQLLLLNNILYLIPVAVLICLAMFWYFLGRDKKNPVVVQYHPPEELTPAEAGLLWDDKLHKKDLISLIYYWAARGIITIEELKDDDYRFTKVSGLSKNARKFEKTIFNALFKKRTTVKLSKLKDSFRGTLRKAHKELIKAVKRDKMYTSGSRLAGTILKIIGILIAFSGLVIVIIGLEDTINLQIPIALTISGFLFFFFGIIMPQKGVSGIKAYDKLVGFREFVKRAELDRIKILLNEHPDYYEKTIAYAIVLGLGEEWAAAFDDLLDAPPAWYTGYSNKVFSTTLFHKSVISSMRLINTNLQATANFYSSSGGSYSGSFGSGSSGSSFSGGGYSGRGFGGGGGSSW